MKSGVKRLLAGITLTGISLFAKADAKFDHYGNRFILTEKNHTYAARKVVNRQEKVGGWDIFDITDENHKNRIGDEKREKELYEDIAFRFTMKDYMPEYSKTLESTSNAFKKVLAVQIGSQALRFSYDELVKIEGSLVASVVTGGASLAGEAQKYAVRQVVSNSINEINNDFQNNLYSRSLEIKEKIVDADNIGDLEKILSEELDKSVHTRLAKSIHQLERAEKLAKKQNRTISEDKIMFEDMVEGLSEGFGIMAYYNEMNKNNSIENLSRTLIDKGTRGAGIPITDFIINKKIIAILREDDHYQSAVRKSELKENEWRKKLYHTFNTNWEGQSVNRFLDYLQKSKEEPQKEIINLYREGVQNIDLDCDGTKEKIEIIKIEDLKGHPNFNSLSKIFINDKPTTTESFCGESVYLKKNKGKCGYYLIRVYSTTDTKPYTTNCFGDDTPYVWNGKTFRKR